VEKQPKKKKQKEEEKNNPVKKLTWKELINKNKK